MRYPIFTILPFLLITGTSSASSMQQPVTQPSTTYATPMQTQTPPTAPSFQTPTTTAAATAAALTHANNSSFAVTLAREAGLIAGAAQACNQNTALLAARLDEAINEVSQSPMDTSDAIAAFQQSTKEAATKQASGNLIPCEIVLRDYQQIPLLRDDYKEVVLSALKADQAHAATQKQQTATPAQTTQQPVTTTPVTTTQPTSNTPMQNTGPIR